MSAVLMATRNWVLSQINQNVASVFKWGGEVASVANLPGYDSTKADTLEINTTTLANPVVGTVYNVTDTGANYVIVKRTTDNIDKYFWDKLSENDYATIKSKVGILETNFSTLDGSVVKKAALVDLGSASGQNETAVKAGSLYSSIISIANVTNETADYAIASANSVKSAFDTTNGRVAALEALLDTTDSNSTISGILSRLTSVETSASNSATAIGDVTSLTTTASNLVGAIEEVKATADAAALAIGDASTLTTTATNLAAAINEVKATADAAIPSASIKSFSETTAGTSKGTDVADAATFKKAINDVDAKVGNLSSLSTTTKTDVVAAINEVKTTADAAVPASDIATSVRASTSASDTKVTSEKAIATEKENLLDGTTSFTTLAVAANGKVVLKGATKEWFLKIDETEGTLSLEENTPVVA